MRAKNGNGSMSFRQSVLPRIPEVTKYVATTFMINQWATRSKRSPPYQASKSTSQLMYSGTALQPIYWKREQISVSSRNCWVTRALKPPRSICIVSTRRVRRSSVHWINCSRAVSVQHSAVSLLKKLFSLKSMIRQIATRTTRRQPIKQAKFHKLKADR